MTKLNNQSEEKSVTQEDTKKIVTDDPRSDENTIMIERIHVTDTQSKRLSDPTIYSKSDRK